MSNQLVLPDGVDKLSLPQKVIALGIVGVAAYYLLPILLAMMVSLLWIVIIVSILGFAAMNYRMIWTFAKWLSWKGTQWLIGLDVLGYMDRYLAYVGEQEQVLLNSKRDLVKELEGVKGQISDSEKAFQEQMNRADAAEKLENKVQFDIAISSAQDHKDYIQTLSPVRDEAEKQVAYLTELTDVFHTKHEQLGNTVKMQRTKYNSLQAMSKGMGAASDVLRGAGGQNEIWKETNRQLIDQMNTFTANIKTFEDVIKPAIEGARFDKQLRETTGKQLLNEFRNTNFKQLQSKN